MLYVNFIAYLFMCHYVSPTILEREDEDIFSQAGISVFQHCGLYEHIQPNSDEQPQFNHLSSTIIGPTQNVLVHSFMESY